MAESRLRSDPIEIGRAVVVATQEGLGLVPRPYHEIADRIGVSPDEVMACFRAMLDSGAVRRIAAVPNHYRLGYRANGMSVWDVDDERASAPGRIIGALDFVSHCYLRARRPPHWRFNLFAMVHGRERDAVHVIDKTTPEIVTLRPEPGKIAAHVEFTRDGRYALLSIWDVAGAIVVYDARSLQKVKRLPMVKLSGKYNVHNKISGDRGTSN